MQNFASDIGLRAIYNASGTMTTLGASIANDDAIVAANDVLRKFVEMPELHRAASNAIATSCNTEAGCVTACVASGITVAVAAAMTGDDLSKIEALPNTQGLKNEVILQKGHDCHFSGQVSQMVKLSGACITEIGSVNRSTPYQLEGAINDNTAAAIYVVSHQTSQTGMIPLAMFIKICHEKNVPVIVDASAEYDLKVFLEQGADLALYSAHKFLGGLTAGIIAGRKDLVRACYLQEQGIGRAMKVGKEGVASTIAVLNRWSKLDHDAENVTILNRAQLACEFLSDRLNVDVSLEADPTGNPVTRVRIHLNPHKSAITAYDLGHILASQNPAIYVRAHDTDANSILLDPCNLTDGEMTSVSNKIVEILSNSGFHGNDQNTTPPANENLLNWPDPPPSSAPN